MRPPTQPLDPVTNLGVQGQRRLYPLWPRGQVGAQHLGGSDKDSTGGQAQTTTTQASSTYCIHGPEPQVGRLCPPSGLGDLAWGGGVEMWESLWRCCSTLAQTAQVLRGPSWPPLLLSHPSSSQGKILSSSSDLFQWVEQVSQLCLQMLSALLKMAICGSQMMGLHGFQLGNEASVSSKSNPLTFPQPCSHHSSTCGLPGLKSSFPGWSLLLLWRYSFICESLVSNLKA